MSFLDDCRGLVGIDSTPSHGNLEAAEFVADLCRAAGLFVEMQRESLEGVDQCNVLARPQPETPKQELMLQTHLDTVDAGHFSQWTKTQSNPFNASIYDDSIFGLGTADTKLDFLCKLEAAREFLGKSLKMPFVLAATFGAQNGMAGAIKLIRRKKINATKALIGEPTNMRLVHAGMGLAVVEISVPFSDEERTYRRNHDLQESASSQSRFFSGRASHSSAPRLGDNAILKMLEYLSHLPEGIAIMDLNGGINYNSVPASAVLEIDMVAGFRNPILPKITKIYRGLQVLEDELCRFNEEGFDPPHPTINLGMVRTSEHEIRFTGSCRLPPSVTDEVYERWMAGFNRSVQAAGATFSVKDYRKGFVAKPGSEFIEGLQGILRDMNLNAELNKITLASEANVFSRLGIECLVWGPGQSIGNSHAPNENIKISDLRAATEFYKRSIERFCL